MGNVQPSAEVIQQAKPRLLEGSRERNSRFTSFLESLRNEHGTVDIEWFVVNNCCCLVPFTNDEIRRIEEAALNNTRITNLETYGCKGFSRDFSTALVALSKLPNLKDVSIRFIDDPDALISFLSLMGLLANSDNRNLAVTVTHLVRLNSPVNLSMSEMLLNAYIPAQGLKISNLRRISTRGVLFFPEIDRIFGR
ncbi:hypothetical protein IV203_030208 [Nitzschia inconspicua]|uniref:Uncharacterized protein n=1 Tax=Nitzschia inconspicua TaxID=303405 RepID=A0A9K3LSW1_9STRA|nr:hypothetical protein IV203_030208 [Nitzschia inconspicua]